MAGKKFKQRKTDVIQDGIVYRLYTNSYPAYHDTYYVYTYTDDLPEKVIVADKIGDIPVTVLDTKCFWHSECREVILPETIEVIKTDAFKCCENLEEISIPNGVREVQAGAFKRCDKLKQTLYSHGLYIGNSENPYLILRTNEKADKSAHDNGIVVEVHPETRFILDTAFCECRENGSVGFGYLPRVKKLILHDKLDFIDSNAFSWMSIPEIHIDSIVWLCKSGVSVPGFGRKRLFVDGKEFDGELIIPATVTDIPQHCFSGYDFIKSVRFEGNVSTIGSWAFSSCINLRDIYFPPKVDTIEKNAFFGFWRLNDVDFYEVEKIDESAFKAAQLPGKIDICEAGLKKITFHERVGKICNKAFGDNINLHAIEGIENVETIEGDPFSTNVVEILAEFPKIDKKSLICRFLDGSPKINLDKLEKLIATALKARCEEIVTTLNNYKSKHYLTTEFIIENGTLTKYCGKGGEVFIPDDVTSIGDRAFKSRIDVESVVIPESVISIGSGVFDGCNNLRTVTIPNTITEIGTHIFRDCESMEYINIPDSVTSIGEFTFAGCKNLKYITIPERVSAIGALAFSQCTNLGGIEIPGSLVSIGDGAFNRCEKLRAIFIPDSVISIEDNAFGYCENLTSVVLGSSITHIGAGAFRNCPKVTICAPAGSYAEEYAKENGIKCEAC